MTIAHTDFPSHTVRAVLPALSVMESLGFDRKTCLSGTGLQASQLANSGSRITSAQELAFYRNTIELTGNPAIGLQLGVGFTPQRYGLFGYALLSASTFRHALSLTEKFGRLTFSFFSFRFGVVGKRAWFSMEDPPVLEQALADLYLDRDMSAAKVDFSEILGWPFVLDELHLSHDGHGRDEVYREHFGCKVCFNSAVSRIYFDVSVLDQPLPQRDPDNAQYFQQQCQLLIAKLSKQVNFIDDVRMILLARPGYFPDIDFVAEKLGMSTRTLRRRLADENSSYRGLLDEIRYGLAKEYLDGSSLPLEEISRLLGYSEPANFSHAFRRWHGSSPSDWRSNVA